MCSLMFIPYLIAQNVQESKLKVIHANCLYPIKVAPNVNGLKQGNTCSLLIPYLNSIKSQWIQGDICSLLFISYLNSTKCQWI